MVPVLLKQRCHGELISCHENLCNIYIHPHLTSNRCKFLNIGLYLFHRIKYDEPGQTWGVFKERKPSLTLFSAQELHFLDCRIFHVRSNVGIHTYSVPAFTSQHLPYRNIGDIFLFISQSACSIPLMALQRIARLCKRSPVHNLPQVFNIKRILTKNRISPEYVPLPPLLYSFLRKQVLPSRRFLHLWRSSQTATWSFFSVKGLSFVIFIFSPPVISFVQYYGRCSHFYYSNIDFPCQSY